MFDPSLLDELDRAVAALPGPERTELERVSRALGSGIASCQSEARDLADAQAEALVTSAMLVSELENTREVLRDALHRAEAASRAKSAFLANMSHELRTPLNAIIGYAELLMENGESRDLAWAGADLGRIRDAGRHLLALVNNVLDLSRIEAGRIDLEIREFAVDELVSPVARDCAMLAHAKHLSFACEVPPEAGRMVSDPTKIRQILLNVLQNACKFTADGSVTLDVAADETSVVFHVRDTGVGMTLEHQEHLFERFRQADSSTTRLYGGTGLGLHISRSLCGLLGGSIAVQSEVGKGTTFTIAFPRVVPQDRSESPLCA